MSSPLAPQLEALRFVRNPFPQTPDADCHFRTPAIARQLVEAEHCLLTGKGFVLLTGEVGTGKSTFLRCLIDRLTHAGCRFAYVFNTFLQGRDLLLAINRDFGLAPGGDMAEDLDRLNHFLIKAGGRGETCVVLIDDAQNFDIATLELVRLLSNLETRQRKLLQIVLAGQPELVGLLSQPALRQLGSRIVQHVELVPFSEQESADYVAFRLAACLADSAPIALTPAAQHALHRHAGGNPRRMHLILDRSLYGVVVQNERRIDAGLIDTAAGEAGMAPLGAPRRARPAALLPDLSGRMRLVKRVGMVALLAGSAAWAMVDSGPPPAAKDALHANGTYLGACFDRLGASAWKPVLSSEMNETTRQAVESALATQGLALARLPASGAAPVGPHCVWPVQDPTWLLWRPLHAPFAIQADAPQDGMQWLQSRLAAAGHYRGAIDGLAGPHTREALRRFRAEHGLLAVPVLDGAVLLLLEPGAPDFAGAPADVPAATEPSMAPMRAAARTSDQ